MFWSRRHNRRRSFIIIVVIYVFDVRRGGFRAFCGRLIWKLKKSLLNLKIARINITTWNVTSLDILYLQTEVLEWNDLFLLKTNKQKDIHLYSIFRRLAQSVHSNRWLHETLFLTRGGEAEVLLATFTRRVEELKNIKHSLWVFLLLWLSDVGFLE